MRQIRISSRHSNPQARGVTRFELIAGGALLAVLVATASFWMGSEQEDAKRGSAEKVAKSLASAASEWKREHAQMGCPTVSLLQHESRYDRKAPADDPWGGRFRISCSATGLSVKSAGGDGRFDTDDDISVDSDFSS